jgi:hypothetical protein
LRDLTPSPTGADENIRTPSTSATSTSMKKSKASLQADLGRYRSRSIRNRPGTPTAAPPTDAWKMIFNKSRRCEVVGNSLDRSSSLRWLQQQCYLCHSTLFLSQPYRITDNHGA